MGCNIKLLKTYFLAFMLIQVHTSIAQVTNYAEYGNVFPSTPEVASIGKYIENPVGYSTGTPSISIPICNASDGKLQLPVSISYNASGIKVEEVASWVGLGWGLNTGASLSRVVNGLPDDINSVGFMYTPYTVAAFTRLPLEDPLRLHIALLLGQNEVDMEPDMFIFSAGSYSGKFYFNQYTREFVQTPFQNIKIKCIKNADSTIAGFHLTTPDGIKYFFGRTEDGSRQHHDKLIATQTVSVNGGITSIAPSDRDVAPHTNNWLPLEIKSTTGNKISLFYTSYSSVDYGRGGESVNFQAASGCEFANNQISASFYENSFIKNRLIRIETRNEIIQFIPSNNQREDLSLLNTNNFALKSIEIWNLKNEKVESFTLYYKYLTSSDDPWIPGVNENMRQMSRKRMILDSIKITGSSTLNSKKYQFEYEAPENLPSRLSTAQDYWGYFNGKMGNQNLIPAVRYSLFYGNPGGYMPGADRTVDINFAKKGTLKKITYPTGGFTSYYYESNIVSSQYISSFLYGFKPSGLTPHNINFFKSTIFQDQINPNLYKHVFNVNNPDGEIKLQSFMTGCSQDYYNVACPVQFSIYNNATNQLVASIGQPLQYLILENGQYRIEALVSSGLGGGLDPNPIPDVDFNVQLSWESNPDPLNAIVGGLRLSKTISDPLLGNPMIKTFSYQRFDNPSISSGELMNVCVHAFRTYCGNEVDCEGCPPSVIKVVSGSAAPLTSSDGQLIRYTNVSEFYDEEQESHYTKFHLTNDQYTYANPATQDYPFPPHLRRDWRNGLLFSKRDYSKSSTQAERQISFETNTYHTFESCHIDTFGLKIGMTPKQSPFTTFRMSVYSFVSEWYLPIQKETFAYSNKVSDNSTLSNVQLTTYNNQYQVNKIQTYNSEQEVLQTTFKYPHDFAGNPVFDSMIARNIMNPVVTQVDSNFTLNKQLSNSSIQYSPWYNSKFIMPIQFEKSFSGAPLEIEGSIILYDHNGNILEMLGRDGINTTILWGYNAQFPVAKIIGKKYNEVISQSQIDTAVLNNINIMSQTMLNELNKLRTMNGCFITTYTYEPLVGITSENGPTGNIIFYEYDAYRRLKHVKDQHGNIKKKYCYNFYGNQVDCLDGN